ncbi:capsular polysaccharide biosynthesis mannose-6-phosphate isomerase/mannose-1-phosphate guanylyl transferase [Bordetella ansorpii]|uniref:mannose-1-phosphate guanylyltransferase n=1 Tax=Bordetella ansorpii TaxID=288768 RepID=A0A157S557_9BORD|nr:mannose-1-phosphate guanylyltransferase/mannose-6-phosphate isomerase [Bordetella ansorpii]SAI65542.1 capsular polysaccharide biosynthesis mannose-6-phosphate isomerase/mannose-1-phosphate guanylyl transferase [Bordetella ansorpii]
MTFSSADCRVVVLCGGAGSRLWPLSREFLPKQFIRLTGARSLLQDTVMRLALHAGATRPLLVCNEAHRFIAAEQLQDLPGIQPELLLEPCPRNTAPAIAAAALRAMHDGRDPVLLVVPSDHVIEEGSALREAFSIAMQAAAEGALVAFGIAPRTPATGYGYLRLQAGQGRWRRVDAFVEKPDAQRAEQFLRDGSYYWNSGMFAFRASVLLAEMERLAPEMLLAVRAAVSAGTGDDDVFRLDPAAFADCPADSIDYAVMEHTDRAVAVPLTAGWSDVGAWDAVWDMAQKCPQGNSSVGDVLLQDSHNCLVHATSRLVATIGLDDIMVIETADAVLVVHKSRAQEVRRAVETFRAQGRAELAQHREVRRPWGAYDLVGQGPRYQIKRITVKPGARLSLQMHHHRAEHWVVVTGTARIRNGERSYLLTENQSTYIPLGETHSLENPGKIALELIEVQSGAYLGEDDIVRLEDIYGRA